MRKRSQRRPRPVGRPLLRQDVRDLMMPAYVGLQVIADNSNGMPAEPQALASAYDWIAGCLDVFQAALGLAGQPYEPVAAGVEVLRTVLERKQRTLTLSVTGPELATLQTAVAHCDDRIGTLRSHHILEAVRLVNAHVDALSATQEPTECSPLNAAPRSSST